MNEVDIQNMAYRINVEACNRLQRFVLRWRDNHGKLGALDPAEVVKATVATARTLKALADEIETMARKEREAA